MDPGHVIQLLCFLATESPLFFAEENILCPPNGLHVVLFGWPNLDLTAMSRSYLCLSRCVYVVVSLLSFLTAVHADTVDHGPAFAGYRVTESSNGSVLVKYMVGESGHATWYSSIFPLALPVQYDARTRLELTKGHMPLLGGGKRKNSPDSMPCGTITVYEEFPYGSPSATVITCSFEGMYHSLYRRSPSLAAPVTTTSSSSSSSSSEPTSTSISASTLASATASSPAPTEASASASTLTTAKAPAATTPAVAPPTPAPNNAWISGPVIGGISSLGLIVAGVLFYLHKRQKGRVRVASPEDQRAAEAPEVYVDKSVTPHQSPTPAPPYSPPQELDHPERLSVVPSIAQELDHPERLSVVYELASKADMK
ncbi:hypothetical protein AJ80_07962 [Polytolypa hystricis UAMH7299]|uniref:Uncharacterized protein n=1 Tax=Polytolypa hystricis (strain UAMH7299) TaxID=1447883 RepID=A0A2B7XGH1_POLH7|nr:hypothetical protein AJ80_07962 [Polytolypa hystricis UAMH7299]